MGAGDWRWTALVGHALEARVMMRRARLDDRGWWKRNTARVQATELRRLLRAGCQCKVGIRHGFRAFRSLPDEEMVRAYRAEVPIGDWYSFREDIAHMRELGEPNVLWPGFVRDFAQTSGTTAGDKFIPVSRAMHRSNFRASLDIFAHLTRFGLSIPDMMNGRCLFLGGSSALEENEHSVRTGDLSGLATQLIRWPLSEIWSPGPEIALEQNWTRKIDRMARLCMDQDVRFISGMPSWALVLFTRMIEMAREDGRDVSCVRDLWPDLRVFVHGGVKYEPFRTRAAKMWSGDEHTDIPHRFELYPASEGFVAMQDEPGDPGLRLNTDIGLFFEFVPLEEIDDEHPNAFMCHEVDKGQRYVVVLTTCAGLWRYVLGDVVEFDTVPAGFDGTGGGGPARLRIVGRHRHFINAFGENLIVEHIERAVAEAARASGVEVGEFTAAPVYPTESTRAGLELAVETTGDRTMMSRRFRDAFDESIKAQNVDYTTKRSDSLGMTEPTITVLSPGTFHRWMESRGKLGGQHKCPRCANHREIIEDVVRHG